ncbi:MAG TPA: DUF3071 domain-containing protein [Blastocatellia bacterium]|nr:DUF3071 domain-containing protein [Blastocatellia bacterium]
MKRFALWISVLLLAGFAGCDNQTKPVAQGPREDPQVTAIKDQIAKTTPEGKTIIEKAWTLKPVVNERVSGKTLGDVVNDYTNNKGPYNITAIGWEAAKKSSGRWKIIFHYRDYQKHYLAAEWEYNPEANSLYPFDFNNAPQFWTEDTEAAAGTKAASAKKK